MDKEFSNEYIKHIFTDDEKKEIAIEIAQKEKPMITDDLQMKLD